MDKTDASEPTDFSAGVVQEAAPAKTSNMVTVDGDLIPKLNVEASTEDHVRGLMAMTLRDDDVFIVAYPKSGTHWVWEIVHMLLSGKVEYESRTKEHLMVEMVELDKVVALPSPRIINSHLRLRHLPREILTKRPKIIHVARNPKDIAVSLYFHMRQLSSFPDSITLDAFTESFIGGWDYPGTHLDYFFYTAEMDQWQAEHPEVPVINVSFKDLKNSPVESVRTLAKFLKVEATDALCAEIAEACSFKNLKKADESKNFPKLRNVFKEGSKLQVYRKGEIDDWKNFFTVALNEKFDAVMEEKLIGKLRLLKI